MFQKEIYLNRREVLKQKMGAGLVLLLGNSDSPMNYTANAYKFRQDSSFLYYFGINTPDYVGIIDVDNNCDVLFADDLTMDDIVWTGPQPSVAEIAAGVGVHKTYPLSALAEYVKGREVHYLPQYRTDNKLKVGSLVGKDYNALQPSEKLIRAVVSQRLVKDEVEIAEMEKACAIGRKMMLSVMSQCRVGANEQIIAGTIEGIALAEGAGVSFPSIITQHGETLHNLHRDADLQDGRLLLADLGAETNNNYCSDYTRTMPVNGKYTSKQREIYQIVLDANKYGIACCKPGVSYADVHIASCRCLVDGLKQVGLLKGDTNQIVAEGAHALFLPHGLGHALGMDVHDMECLGEQYVGYEEGKQRSTQFGLSALRFTRTLQQGNVVTVEPGIYFIPQLIDQWEAEGRFADYIQYEALRAYRDFGGIRIEDDVLITTDGSRVLGEPIPKEPAGVEALLGK